LRTNVRILAATAAIVALTTASPAPAVYHGERAPFDSFGFMVSLRPRATPDAHSCGGTLIAPDIVLSAAHCLVGGVGLVAVVGTDATDSETAQRVRITGRRVPREYAAGSNRGDIALLRLATPQASPVATLGDAEPGVGTLVTPAGWGCTRRPWPSSNCVSTPTPSDHLRTAEQQVVPDSRCNGSKFSNPHAYAPTSICARGSDAVATPGDSGGPLLIGDAESGYTQIGVVSLLADKRRAPLNAYTSVPVMRGWIEKAMAALRR
jgi:secreted trypsin-like serine protease